MTNKTASKHHFENNPFFIASNGITSLANKAQGVFILFVVLAIFGLFTNNSSPEPTNDTLKSTIDTLQHWTVPEWSVAVGSAVVITLAFALVSALFGGISSYTSAQLVVGQRVNLRDAIRTSFENLWAYLWLQIIIIVKVILWGLLFIVPGIIMAVRYSLAGVAFYDEKKNLRGNAAIQESIRMTKNGWITTYASNALFNILTLGVISTIVSTGANAVLYRQFEQSGDKKPAAHWLSWVTLLLPLILLLTAIILIVTVAFVLGILGISVK